MRGSNSWFKPVTYSLLLGLAACTKAPAPTAEAPAAPATPQTIHPVDSVIGLMANQISPSANFLWEAVGTVSGPKGTEEKQPRTDPEWAEVRRQALILIEASNLLMVEGRHVGLPGEKRAGTPGPTDLTPEQAEAAITKDWATWIAFSQTLRATAQATLKTIDARDAAALMESGSDIDEACEVCHKKFWYPVAVAAAP
jgi:hypothetical protein